jgi:hypothetical protein
MSNTKEYEREYESYKQTLLKKCVNMTLGAHTLLVE